MKLRNVALTTAGGGQLQLLFTVKSLVQEANPALVQRLEGNIRQRAAIAHTAPHSSQQQQRQHNSCTLNLLSAPHLTPLRCVRSSAAVAGKYRVLCRAVSVWPADLREWSHYCCVRCGDRTECSEASEVGSASGCSACRACGGADSRRCEWGFSVVLEDATAMLQAEVWGSHAVGNTSNHIPHTHSSQLTHSLTHSLASPLSLPRSLLMFVLAVLFVCVVLVAGSVSVRSARRQLVCERSDARLTPHSHQYSHSNTTTGRLLLVELDTEHAVSCPTHSITQSAANQHTSRRRQYQQQQ